MVYTRATCSHSASARAGHGYGSRETLMCGRFASFLPASTLQAIFGTVNALPNTAPSWNVSPMQSVLVVRWRPETRQRYLNRLRWGLITSVTTDLTCPKPTIARTESIVRNGMFRDSFIWRRCLVPAGAFYEWKGSARSKQPYAVARVDGAPLALAGIWSGWKSPAGEGILSFAIITVAANAVMRQLHDRMPVVVEESDWPVWLGEEEEGDPVALLQPSDKHMLRLWPVSRAVNRVRNDSPNLLDPVDDLNAL